MIIDDKLAIELDFAVKITNVYYEIWDDKVKLFYIRHMLENKKLCFLCDPGAKAYSYKSGDYLGLYSINCEHAKESK